MSLESRTSSIVSLIGKNVSFLSSTDEVNEANRKSRRWISKRIEIEFWWAFFSNVISFLSLAFFIFGAENSELSNDIEASSDGQFSFPRNEKRFCALETSRKLSLLCSVIHRPGELTKLWNWRIPHWERLQCIVRQGTHAWKTWKKLKLDLNAWRHRLGKTLWQMCDRYEELWRDSGKHDFCSSESEKLNA